MADIIVRMAINPVGNGEIGSIATNNYELLNNISIKANSSGVFDVINDDSFKGTEMLAFNKGVLNFNKAGFLSNRKDGEAGRLQSSKRPRQYVWGTTDNNGYALDKNGNIVELVLTLNSTGSTVKFDSIVITGDSIAKQFPIEAYLDDSTEPIYSDDSKWAIKFDTNTTSHTIRFTKWNRANYNAVLNSVRVMYKYINITDKVIEDISSLSETTSDASNIDYGVIANSGHINITDSNGEIEDLIRDEILPNSDVELDIQYNGNIIQHHITNDTDYKTDTKEFNLSLSNKVKDLDVLIYKGYAYPNESRSLYDMLFDVMKSLSGDTLTDIDFQNMVSNKCFAVMPNILNRKVEDEIFIYDYLKNIIIPYPVIESGKTYREVIDDICTVSQLRMFVNDNNEYEFISARPLILSTDNYYFVENKIIMSEPITDVVVKNKFDAVELNEVNIIDEIDYDTVIYPANVGLENVVVNDLLKNEKDNQQIIQRSQFISGATFYYEIASYILSNYYYYQGVVTIPKKSSNNLSQVTSINDTLFRNNNFAYRMTYNKYVANASADSVWDRGDNIITVSNIVYDSNSFSGQVSEDGLFEDNSDYSITLPDSTTSISSTSTTPNAPQIEFTEDNNNYYVSYNICVRKELTKLGGYYRWTSASTSSGSLPLVGVFETYIPLTLEFSIYGNKRVISFETVSASSPNISNSKHKVLISSNNLLQSGTTFYGQKISDVIKTNIISDYNKGVQSKKLDLICYDIKDSLGNIAINNNNGEILKPNNIIYSNGENYPDGSQKYWRIFSREFVYDGEPYLKTISEEAKKILQDNTNNYGLFTLGGYFIKSWDEMVEDGDITISNNSIEKTSESFREARGFLKIKSGLENINIGTLAPYISDKWRNSKIDKLFIPKTVKSFYSDGYYLGFPYLSEIEIEEGSQMETMGGLVANFKEITIPENVKNLTKIDSDFLEVVNYNAIQSNDRLYSSVNFEQIFRSEQNDIIFNIGKKVKRIPKCLLYGSDADFNVGYINFPLNSVCESIGERAFNGISSLKSVNIPKSVKLIEPNAFWNSGSYNNYFNAIFENTSGWFVADSADATSGTSIDVSDARNAGELLSDTYRDKYFINKS